MSLTMIAARALEAGRLDGPVARAVAAVVAPVVGRGLVRPGVVPGDVAVVSVGGATLGGSGKTRVAVACARTLAERTAARVALVGHAYGGSLGGARVVSQGDALAGVGDEAIVCARALAPLGVTVVVGPTRQAAIDRALALRPRPEVLVVDGALRLRHTGARTLSVLSLDARRPWGSARVPPAGDLRAPRERLLALADQLVHVEAAPVEVRWSAGRADERRAPIGSLGGRRLGLFTALARPARIVEALADVGVRPAVVVSARDHGPPSPGERRAALGADVEAWIATEKCALHLEALGVPVPIGVLAGAFELSAPLPPSLVAALVELAGHASDVRIACEAHLHGACGAP